MKNVQDMTKAELIELVEKLQEAKGKGRKEAVLNLLKEGYDSIDSIAEQLGITSKNVSSILTALRKNGNYILSLRVGGNSVLKLIDFDEAQKIGLV